MSYFVSAAGRAYCGPRFQVGVRTQSTPYYRPVSGPVPCNARQPEVAKAMYTQTSRAREGAVSKPCRRLSLVCAAD